MGLKRVIKKTVGRAAKFEATRLRRTAGIAEFFVPGLGTVSKEVAKLYDRLSAKEQTKFHSAKTKAAKNKILRRK